MTLAPSLSKPEPMSTATLTVDLDAITANWRSLNAMTRSETGAVVKADAYGLGAARVGRALVHAGVRSFFVAVAEEGAALRQALGPAPAIYIFSGHMPGDTDMIGDLDLIPMINSLEQMIRQIEALPGHPFGLQLDTGMNRLGMEPDEWAALRDIALGQAPRLIMSHLACADEPDHPMNAQQLQTFLDMTAGINAPRSLSNTGGVLLGEDYHFDLTRPGIGLYGGLPFERAHPVAAIEVPVIQCRTIEPGESVGYSQTFITDEPRRIATISAGYADGVIRAMGPQMQAFAGDVACPLAGRISMDLIGVDITALKSDPKTLDLLGPQQTVDMLADMADTIGYEILTSLGTRYARRYVGG